jgi:hypothetical protein
VTPGDDLDDLEVIELEPADPEKRQPDGARSSTRVGRRRWPLVVAGVLVVALVGSALVDRSRRSRATSPTTRAGQTDIGVNGAPLFTFRAGSQILAAGFEGLRLVDTDTGAVSTPLIQNLPPGPVSIVAHAAGTVAVRIANHLYWFTLEERLAHRTSATTAFPGTRRGSLWLAGLNFAIRVPGGDYMIGTAGTAIGATAGGLLVPSRAGVMLQAESGIEPSRLFLRAPATVIGVHRDRVAWVADDCGVIRCPVHVTEVATRKTATWIQLVGASLPGVVEDSSGVFSPDGASLAVVVSNGSFTAAATIVVADLRTRATAVINALGRFDQPARPGSADEAGATVEWTLDARYLLFATSSEARSRGIGVVDPPSVRVTTSRALGLGSTLAVVGPSTRGALDLPRHVSPRPVDTGGPTRLREPGQSLVAADLDRLETLDLDTDTVSTWYVEGVLANTAGPNSIARVATGWLIARNGLVDLLTIANGSATTDFVAPGSQVFSADHGEHAWIFDAAPGAWRVQAYDPATEALKPTAPLEFITRMAAADGGLFFARADPQQGGTRLDMVDSVGVVHEGVWHIDSPAIEMLAGAGSSLVYRDDRGLFVLDLTTPDPPRRITAQFVKQAALSPDGRNLAWIDREDGPPSQIGVRATRVDNPLVVRLAPAADQVVVSNAGVVIFTTGYETRRGRVDENGSRPMYGLAPAPEAKLALL